MLNLDIKTQAAAAVALLALCVPALAAPHVWHDLDQATAAAAASSKPVLVEIGSKW